MYYSVKTWATTILAGPLMLVLGSLLLTSGNTLGSFKAEDTGIIIIIIMMGAFFSLPNFGLFCFVTRLVTKRLDNGVYIKLVLSVIGVLLIYLPFLLIDDGAILLNIDQLSRSMFISYSVVFIASVWIYKLKPANFAEALPETNQ